MTVKPGERMESLMADIGRIIEDLDSFDGLPEEQVEYQKAAREHFAKAQEAFEEARTLAEFDHNAETSILMEILMTLMQGPGANLEVVATDKVDHVEVHLDKAKIRKSTTG